MAAAGLKAGPTQQRDGEVSLVEWTSQLLGRDRPPALSAG
jgi:hypothetical protein